MRTVEYTCKICKRPGTARVDDDCPDEWAAKFAPMLTCNRCFDIREKYRNAEDAIYKICGNLLFFRDRPENEKSKLLAASRDKLNVQSRRLAQALSDYFNLNEVIWEPGVVDLFMDKPDKAQSIIIGIRKTIKGFSANPMEQNVPQATQPDLSEYRAPYAD